MRAIVATLLTLGLVACSSGTKSGPLPQRPSGPRAPIADNSEQRVETGLEKPDLGRLLTAYFDYDDSALRADAKSALRQNAETLRTRASARVELQGNCDERGTDEYNMALGKRRAEAAKRYLADLGIPDSRMTTVSFGEENPAVQGGSESAWAKNRRVDFVLR